MKYRIKELNANAFMVQRSLDGETWHDGVPVPAPTEALAHAYVASMREFDARDTEGVVVWHSEWVDRPKTELVEGTVMRFEDFLK
jgi:hypothetical protein